MPTYSEVLLKTLFGQATVLIRFELENPEVYSARDLNTDATDWPVAKNASV